MIFSIIKPLLYFPFFLLLGCTKPPVKIKTLVENKTETEQTSITHVANVPYYIDKKLRTENYIYEPIIHTVQLYQKLSYDQNGNKAVELPPPLSTIDQTSPLVLEFDEITDQTHAPFHVRLYHCNSDWSLSMLSDIEYLHDFNDFSITKYEYSSGPKVPYIHYTFELPKVKLSGNYIVMVHREGNIKDILLTSRFLIYENIIQINANVRASQGIRERFTHQQVDFSINYSGYDLINPRDAVKINLRQNFKWADAITKLNPYAIREDNTTLDYTFFNLENNFPGGNEFRYFDIRSLKFLGVNVFKLNIKPDTNEVILGKDKTRATEPYTQVKDMNGNYVIDNYESNNGATYADYSNVKFTLMAPQPAPGDVYIYGAITNWQMGDENKMVYNKETQSYSKYLLLKQGYYNFQYVLEKPTIKLPDASYFEGDHFETENMYDIIVYYRPPGARNDLIIGYKQIDFNSRR